MGWNQQLEARAQVELDARRTRRQRNVIGQFATPGPLALEMLRSARGPDPRPDRRNQVHGPGLRHRVVLFRAPNSPLAVGLDTPHTRAMISRIHRLRVALRRDIQEWEKVEDS